ncbi:MAG: helix-turn-helix transcriptional regulator [Saprospiraceae bacterium]|nr:helix-turn-helix transcriptional regulator [Saprospiraceae bacterium]
MINLDEGQYFGRALQSTDELRFKLSLTSYEKGERIEAHCHSNPYLSILTHGTYIEDNGRDSRLIRAGDIVFRPSQYIHQNIFQDRASTCFNIEFKAGWEKEAVNSFAFPSGFATYSSDSHPAIFKILWAHHRDPNSEAVLQILYNWLDEINAREISCRKSRRVVLEVQQILSTELDQFHSLQGLSQRVFVHPVYLARTFKKYTGKTISQYQMRIKLAHTVELLLNTKLKLSEISFESGFYDDAHLIRAFKRHYGISPHQFRLRLKA